MTSGNFLKLFWYLNSAAFIVGQSSQRYYCAITVGADAVISAYRLVCSILYYDSFFKYFLTKVSVCTPISYFVLLNWISLYTFKTFCRPKQINSRGYSLQGCACNFFNNNFNLKNVMEKWSISYKKTRTKASAFCSRYMLFFYRWKNFLFSSLYLI